MKPWASNNSTSLAGKNDSFTVRNSGESLLRIVLKKKSTRLTELPPKKSRTRSKSKVLSDAVAQRIVGPSQLSVSILQESPLNTALKKDRRSGNVEDPLKYGDLSNFFYYELSSFKPNGSLPSKLCIKEMEHRQGSASFFRKDSEKSKTTCGVSLVWHYPSQ